MDREAKIESGRRTGDRARVDNVGVDEESLPTDDVETDPGEGQTVDDV